MNFIFYHRNLKPLASQKLSIKKARDIGSKLILDGFKNGYDVKKQIAVYIAFINNFQNTKLYKSTEADKEYYISCILALYKLEILDPDDPTDPIYIAPLRKKKKKV
tara:strand:+ start:1768 stop:2085 length:318 start_codon:yes stop_codon:yes gene_type:complete